IGTHQHFDICFYRHQYKSLNWLIKSFFEYDKCAQCESQGSSSGVGQYKSTADAAGRDNNVDGASSSSIATGRSS
uniref:Uncharacterized protein n=1 Tax=Oryza glaberrima TaxID=4538 RepID=I1QE16_ORYGL